MIYREFVSTFSKLSGRTFVESKEICDQMLHIIMETIKGGEPINIYGFGILETYNAQPRKYTIPSNGATGYGGGGLRVRFKTGKKFLDVLNGRAEEDYDDE